MILHPQDERFMHENMRKADSDIHLNIYVYVNPMCYYGQHFNAKVVSLRTS